MIQLCCHFTAVGDDFADHAREPVTLLAAQPTAGPVRLARSTEDPGRWILTAEFDSFPGYRAALSPMSVRMTVIPFLSEADPALSGVYEVHAVATDDGWRDLETVVDHGSG